MEFPRIPRDSRPPIRIRSLTVVVNWLPGGRFRRLPALRPSGEWLIKPVANAVVGRPGRDGLVRRCSQLVRRVLHRDNGVANERDTGNKQHSAVVMLPTRVTF